MAHISCFYPFVWDVQNNILSQRIWYFPTFQPCLWCLCLSGRPRWKCPRPPARPRSAPARGWRRTAAGAAGPSRLTSSTSSPPQCWSRTPWVFWNKYLGLLKTFKTFRSIWYFYSTSWESSCQSCRLTALPMLIKSGENETEWYTQSVCSALSSSSLFYLSPSLLFL